MKKKILDIGGVILLVALLGGAAFVGGRLLNNAPAQKPAQGAGGLTLKSGGPSGPQSNVKLQTIPAKELPQVDAAVKGIFVSRKDSSVLVGTGQVRMMAQQKADGTVSMSTNHDGPTVEVVLTHDTQIWRDVTLKQFEGQQPSGETTVQQVIEPGNIDEIAENCNLTVWGERRGDRVTATILMYSLPVLGPGTGGGG
ncbi:MAG: hypothetical protein AB1817_19405 [Chloroflexota bacterium]